MNNPKFYNKDGTLTVYAFACGYIEQKEFPACAQYDRASVKLYRENACWHVQCWPRTDSATGWRCFHGYRGLTEARAFYRQACKAYKSGQIL